MSSIDEKAILEKIQLAFGRGAAEVGIGDDAAVVSFPGRTVVTTDVLVEGVDFTAAIPPSYVARKSLAVNLSDIAAMGATPTHFVLSLAMPGEFLDKLDEFIVALAAMAKQHRVELIGGDLSRAQSLSIAITAMGRVAERPLLRGGAKPGDRIFVSRELGGSAAGLELFNRGWRLSSEGRAIAPGGKQTAFEQRAFAEAALLQHAAPEPEVGLGPRLAGIDAVHACIDISDGLSTDLARVCDASGVGAIVEWERIPPFRELAQAGASLIDLDTAVLHGGEELALLFTADARESELSRLTGRPVYAIGKITSERELLIERNGVRSALELRGFDHFRGC